MSNFVKSKEEATEEILAMIEIHYGEEAAIAVENMLHNADLMNELTKDIELEGNEFYLD